MTFVEKYPHSVEAILQREAQNMVNAIYTAYYLAPIDEYIIKVQLDHIVWNSLNTHQQDYFTSLFGGSYYITKLKGRDGYWLCVNRVDMHGFHYHAPLRVHPVRVYK